MRAVACVFKQYEDSKWKEGIVVHGKQVSTVLDANGDPVTSRGLVWDVKERPEDGCFTWICDPS